VDSTGLPDRTAPAQTPAVNMAGYGARRITTASSQREADVTQQIAAQYLMLAGK
jgi:hypothetical protein